MVGMRRRRLGQAKSKVLILRIPEEWWAALQRIEEKINVPPRELIRNAVETYLERVSK